MASHVRDKKKIMAHLCHRNTYDGECEFLVLLCANIIKYFWDINLIKSMNSDVIFKNIIIQSLLARNYNNSYLFYSIKVMAAQCL